MLPGNRDPDGFSHLEKHQLDSQLNIKQKHAVSELYQQALRDESGAALSSTGALIAYSGEKDWPLSQ